MSPNSQNRKCGTFWASVIGEAAVSRLSHPTSCHAQHDLLHFIAFWLDRRTFRFRQLAPLAIYLGGLTLSALAIRLVDITAHFALPAFAAAIAFVVLLPLIYPRIYWKRYDAFIRCPRCRDWVGRDSSGAWQGPNPKWVTISQTGHCEKCGARIITSRRDQTRQVGS